MTWFWSPSAKNVPFFYLYQYFSNLKASVSTVAVAPPAIIVAWLFTNAMQAHL